VVMLPLFLVIASCSSTSVFKGTITGAWRETCQLGTLAAKCNGSDRIIPGSASGPVVTAHSDELITSMQAARDLISKHIQWHGNTSPGTTVEPKLGARFLSDWTLGEKAFVVTIVVVVILLTLICVLVRHHLDGRRCVS
jgi:hypothetical protein